jgi:hypothetical protein
MEDVRREHLNPSYDAVQRVDVAQTELAGDRDALESEREAGTKFREDSFGAGAAGRAVENEPHAMPAPGLPLHQVNDMPKQAAERGAQDVQNLEARRAKRGLGVRRRGDRCRGRTKRRSDWAQIAHDKESLKFMAKR